MMNTNQSFSASSGSEPLDTVAVSQSEPKRKESPKKTKKSSSAFRTISEVANELDVQQHVLRFWETRFSQVRPLKRGGGRRYYRPEDVALLKKIHYLLYTEGYTIKGVQKLLKGQSKSQILMEQNQEEEKALLTKGIEPANIDSSVSTGLTLRQRSLLESMLEELRDIQDLFKAGANS